MPFPVTIPFAFGARSGNVSASELDTDYQALATACNELKALIDAIVTGNVSGTGVAGQVALWAGTNVITGDPGLTYNPVTGLSLPSLTLPHGPLASLPPPGQLARIFYVTDDLRGPWVDEIDHWQPLLPFDVGLYGARGDGVTDDRAAIQDCIDACANAGGGLIRVPTGIYMIGAPGLTTAAGTSITLQGYGAGSSHFRRLGAGHTLLTIPNPYNCYVLDLHFDGNGQIGDCLQVGPTTIANTPPLSAFASHTGYVRGCIFSGTPLSAVDNSAYFYYTNMNAGGGDAKLFGVLDCQFAAGAWHIVIEGPNVGPLVVSRCFSYHFGRNAVNIETNPAPGNSLLAEFYAIIGGAPGAGANIRMNNAAQMHFRNGYSEGSLSGFDINGTCVDVRIQDCYQMGNVLFNNAVLSDVAIVNNDWSAAAGLSVTGSFTAGAQPLFWQGNSYAGSAPLRSTLPTAFVVRGNTAGNYSEEPQTSLASGLSVTVGPGGGFTTVYQQDYTLHRAPGGVRVQVLVYGLGSSNAVDGSVRVRCGAPGAEVLMGMQDTMTVFRSNVGKSEAVPIDNVAAAWVGGTFRVIVEAQETSGGGNVLFFTARITVTPY